MNEVIVQTIGGQYNRVQKFLDERSRRIWAASEAASIGYGGISAVSTATGLCPRSLRRGLEELPSSSPLPAGSIRHPRWRLKKMYG